MGFRTFAYVVVLPLRQSPVQYIDLEEVANLLILDRQLNIGFMKG